MFVRALSVSRNVSATFLSVSRNVSATFLFVSRNVSATFLSVSRNVSATFLFGTIVAAACLATVPANAHHSFAAEFDETKPIKLTGKVIEMRWANPHAWIYLEVNSAQGKPEKWAFETGAANALFRRGWRKEDLPAGTVLVIEGWLARNGSKTVNAGSIQFEDGRRLFAGSSNPNAKAQ